MATLHELTSEFAVLAHEAEMNGGEIPADAEARIDYLGGDIRHKFEQLDRWRRNLEADRAAVATEAARIARIDATIGRRIDWLKSYMMRGLTAAQWDKIGGATWGISIASSPPSVNVAVDVHDLPAAFKREVREVTVDRKAILAAHKAGGELPAGVTVTVGTHLRFK